MPNKLDRIELRSEEVQDILNKIPHWMIRYGNTLLFTIILLIFFLSWLIKYPDIVLAQTSLTTRIPPQKEYAKITGRLDTICVQEGSLVNAEQPLAVIENAANFRDVYILKHIMDTLQGLKGHEFYFPIEEVPLLFLGEIETDYAVFENNYLNYALNKELNPYKSSLLNSKISLQELKNRLINLKSQKQLNESELSFKEKDLERNKKLYDKGVISLQEYESKQMEYISAERNYKNISSSMHQLKEAISNAEQQTRSTKIEQQIDEATLLKKVVQSYHQLKRSLKDWEFKYVLKSNIEGKVSFLNYWSTNQTVQQGDWVFTIIPQKNSPYIAKLKTPIQNSGKIKIGQEVNIRLDNYPSEEYGVLKGNVSHISTLPSQEGYYIIDVQIADELVTSYQKKIHFKPNLSGTGEIVTKDLRLIERFFHQFRKLLERDSINNEKSK